MTVASRDDLIPHHFANIKPVDFLLVGAQKSGTTTLHSYISEHPQIQMATKKEVHFFDNDKYFSRAPQGYEYYHSWFETRDNERLMGESTPAYLYCRNAASRIWEYNPKMKIIIILRNPIDRAFSHWNMEVNRGAEDFSFKEALLREVERCRETLPSQHYVYSYVDRGYYISQIREYWRFFRNEQVLVLKYDDLCDTPVSILEEVFTFLGADKGFVDIIASQNKILHKASYSSSLDRDCRRYLVKCFKYEILKLESMFGWDCSGWYNEQ